MLSSLVPPMLPSAVTNLFDPPLDGQHFHMSLLKGTVELEHLKFNAQQLNQYLSPLSPIQVAGGTIRELMIEINWCQLRSKPFQMTADKIHLQLINNPIGVKQRQYVESTAKEKVPTDSTSEWTKDVSPSLSQSEKSEKEVKSVSFEPSTSTAIPSTVKESATSPPAISATLGVDSKSHFAEVTKEATKSEPVTKEHHQPMMKVTKVSATLADTHVGQSASNHPLDDPVLKDAAIRAKLAALELIQPNSLNFSPATIPFGVDTDTIGITGITKRIVEFILKGYSFVKINDITIEYLDVNENAKAGPTIESSMSSGVTSPTPESYPWTEKSIHEPLSKTDTSASFKHAPSTTSTASVTGDTSREVKKTVTDVNALRLQSNSTVPILGVHIGSVVFDSFKSSAEQLGLPSQMTAIKDCHLENLSIWCDSEKVEPKDAKVESDWKKETGSIVETSVHHTYILPPISHKIHLATNCSLDHDFEVILKIISPSVLTHIRPSQLQALVRVFKSLQQNVMRLQSLLEAVANRHFRSADQTECDEYIQYYQAKYTNPKRKFSTAQLNRITQIERDVSFADLIAMRAMGFTRKQDLIQHKAHAAEMKAVGVDTSSVEEFEGPEESPTPPDDSASYWTSLKDFIGIHANKEDEAVSGTAPSTTSSLKASPPTKTDLGEIKTTIGGENMRSGVDIDPTCVPVTRTKGYGSPPPATSHRGFTIESSAPTGGSESFTRSGLVYNPPPSTSPEFTQVQGKRRKGK